MSAELNVKILAKSGVKKIVSVSSLTIGTKLGEISILPEHANFFSLIEPSVLKLEGKDESSAFVVSSGFLSVENNSVSIFIDNIFEQKNVNKDEELQKITLLEDKITKNGTTYLEYEGDLDRLKEAKAKSCSAFM